MKLNGEITMRSCTVYPYSYRYALLFLIRQTAAYVA